MVRLWVNGEDFGKMSEFAASSYKRLHDRSHPDDVVWYEPVPDDAPQFLHPGYAIS
jgi:hypothetical protein